MESGTVLNQTGHRSEINKENPKMVVNHKRKRLSDITNIVGSSRVTSSNAQFQENQKEVPCDVTKESIGKLLEENATLWSALGERKRIVDMSNIELQKLRLTVEKASQQNRMLAVANSQMLSELTSSKERLKALQHELGCTVAVLRLKSLALDEKEKLNKELNAKIRIMEKKMHNELYDNTRAEGVSTCAEVVAGAYIGTNSMGCNQSRRRTLGNETLGSTTFTHQAEEKPANEPDENIRAEVLSYASS